ncbi:hypothetical protein QAD02_008676 [Eretmocerus hayati]|uniref:Uncharacterized protein n=1 Tax=Eretmocerus hayati TaxID=131215 RepID=A0ACC2N744_9HYME|nr:hypothetical protein QAD02_008676 [Eretmocerus hayati]
MIRKPNSYYLSSRFRSRLIHYPSDKHDLEYALFIMMVTISYLNYHVAAMKSQQDPQDDQGDEVHGEYQVHEPGGNIRTVKYHADPHGGFFAEVLNHGGNDHSGYGR